jgi:hypothetical protein
MCSVSIFALCMTLPTGEQTDQFKEILTLSSYRA